MAEAEIEELLDFDGSDYEFGSDEGIGDEEDVEYHVAEENAGPGQDPAPDPGEEQVKGRDSREVSGSGEPEKAPDRRAVERGGGRVAEVRNPRQSHSKNDLEDGEFDTAMVNSKKQTEHGAVKDATKPSSRKHHTSESMRDVSGREADSRQGRKRRRDHDYERYQQYSSWGRKQHHHERQTGRYDRSSDRRYDRFGDIPESRTRGAPFLRPNFSPGIMGPGRPDMNHIRGLEIFSAAQLQELLNQEHMLRSQQMLHLARLGIRPPPGQQVYPLLSPNLFRPPLQPMGHDVDSPRLNFLGGIQQGHTHTRSCFPPPTGRGPNGAGFARPPASDGSDGGGRSHLASTQAENGKRPARNSPSAKHEQQKSVARRNDKDAAELKSRSRRTAMSGAVDATAEQDNRARSSIRASDPSGNLIQLGGPVQKSRILTVSGLLENTPMSAVADAFEKQGKLLDFRKNQTGDVFTVTFSSVQEAVSAKRHLHRSMLAGRQITVEYAVA